MSNCNYNYNYARARAPARAQVNYYPIEWPLTRTRDKLQLLRR